MSSLMLVGITASPAAAADYGNPGDPSDPGGGSTASAQTNPFTSDISATVKTGSVGTSGGAGATKCTWVRGQMGKSAGVVSKDGSQFKLVDSDGTERLLYGRRCGNETEITWIWIQRASARQVAEMGLDRVREKLPIPRAVFSPNLSDASAVAHFPLWFAVPPGQWQPVSATATDLGLSATVTAVPSRLSFKPGDGSRTVVCAGPGARWHAGMTEPARPPACSYTYSDASSVAPNGTSWGSKLSISWQVRWTATNGEGGALDALTTTTGYAVAVREIQAVETDRAGQ